MCHCCWLRALACDPRPQTLYRTLHHAFISESGANIFAIVFDFYQAYTAAQGDQQQRNEYTASLLFWYRSIQTYAGSELGVTAFMVGTHADEVAEACGAAPWKTPLPPQLVEAAEMVDRMLQEAFKQHHPEGWEGQFVLTGVREDGAEVSGVVLGFFPWGPGVDVDLIQQAISASIDKQPCFNAEYPVCWLRAVEALQLSGRDLMRVDEVMALLQPLDPSFADVGTVKAMLQQFHRVGELIFFDHLTPSVTENLVVIQPLWVVEAFKPVMARKPFGEALTAEELTVPASLASRSPGPVSAEAWHAMWRQFLEGGLLSRDLLEHHLWRDVVDPALVDTALLLLERLDLILPLRPGGSGYMLVPCVPLHYWPPGEGVEGVEESDVVLRLKCKGEALLPGGFFPRLLLEGVRQKVGGLLHTSMGLGG